MLICTDLVLVLISGQLKLIGNSVCMKAALMTSLTLSIVSGVLYYSNVVEVKLFSASERSVAEGSGTPPVADITNAIDVTLTLTRMLNETTDMEKPDFSRPCTNLWIACTQSDCPRNLSAKHGERVWDLLSPRFRLSQSNLDDVKSLSRDIPENDVIFVAATSSNHFDETQAMIHSLHTVVYPRVKNMSFVLFDIGLTAMEVELAKKGCKCHVITFPFNKFPAFFRERGCYTWKPLIVLAAMLKARKLVVYQDASISWKEPVLELLDRGDKLGVQLFGANGMHNIPVATLKGMFDYFGDEPCAYLPYTQIQSGIGVFKNSPFIIQTILEPWAKCGFEQSCFCPNTSPANLDCNKPKDRLHICHRYDQSALSMIFTKLFVTERYRFHMAFTQSDDGKYIKIDRDQKKPNYFAQVISQTQSKT